MLEPCDCPIGGGFCPVSRCDVNAALVERCRSDDAFRAARTRRSTVIPSRGLGDVVASVAQPIARTIDRLFGTNVAGCGGCSKRQEQLNEWGSRFRSWMRGEKTEAVPLILTNKQSPGDVVVMTGVVRELHRQYPGRFVTAVRTPASELWEHNPNVVKLDDGIEVPVTYEGIHESNQSGKHFMQAMADDLAVTLQLPTPLRIDDARGDIHLGDAERTEYPFDVADPYWLVCNGTKSDYTTKAWPYYAEVVRELAGKVQFVQVGQVGRDSGITHSHPRLYGTFDLLGRTGHRDLIHLVAHAQGILCGVSYLMHLAAAFRKPAVILAGGREPVAWNSYDYPGFHLHHSVGSLDCCVDGGCWKSRTVPLHDRDEKDTSLCLHPEDRFPRCMKNIGPQTIIQEIHELATTAQPGFNSV